jgi:transposase InsO family protein
MIRTKSHPRRRWLCYRHLLHGKRGDPDECLNREWLVTRREAIILIEKWRQFYNNERPHSALGNRTPAEAGLQRLQNKSARVEDSL